VLCSISFCNSDRDVTHKYRNLELDFALNAVDLKFSCDRVHYMNLMLLVVLLHTTFKAILLDFVCNFSTLHKDNRIVKIVSFFMFFGYLDWGFSALFPQLLGKCQGIINKDWARPTSFQICYLCCLFVCYSCCFVVYCDALCIACKCVLPPGVNPIAVDKYININVYVNTNWINYYSVDSLERAVVKDWTLNRL
jgi:hypothetical protein